LDGEEVWRDVVYAKVSGSNVILRDVLGEARSLPGCRILEVDVASERLILTKEK